MVMYSISSKLNSPFSTISKATADKITAKRVGKNSRGFRFCVNNINSNMQSCSEEARLRNFEHFCAFKSVFSLTCICNETLLLLNYLSRLSFGCLYLGILGFKSEQVLDAGFLHI